MTTTTGESVAGTHVLADVPGPGFVLLYDHPYSFESDAWLQADRMVDFPVCIMNAGYSSGWCLLFPAGVPRPQGFAREAPSRPTDGCAR